MGILDDIAGFLGQVGSSPSNEANYLQRQLEKQAAAQRQSAGISQGTGASSLAVASDPSSSLDNISNQLIQQLNSVPDYSTPYDVLLKQATSQANSQYNPLIDALQNQIVQKQVRADRSEKQAKQMYGDLSKDMLSQLPGMQQQAQQDQADTNARYSQAQQQMQQDYQNQASQQAAVLRRLGIQAAAPDATAQQQNDQQYFQNQNKLQQNADVSAQQQQAQSANTYQHNIADSSRLAGVNTAQDIAQQLSDYLDTANSQVDTYKAQRQGAVQSILGQLQSSDAKQANTQHQQEIDNLMALANFQLSAAKAANSADSNASDSLFKGTSGAAGASNYLAESLGSRTGTASQIMKLINDTMADPNVIAGKHQQLDANGKAVTNSLGQPTTLQNTPQYIEDILRQKMQQAGGYDNGDINDAINALLAYLGKLR